VARVRLKTWSRGGVGDRLAGGFNQGKQGSDRVAARVARDFGAGTRGLRPEDQNSVLNTISPCHDPTLPKQRRSRNDLKLSAPVPSE